MTTEFWKIIMYDGVLSYNERHTGLELNLNKIINNIKSPIVESDMNTDTIHRTGGIVRGAYNVFEPEEIQLFEQLLIRK